MQLHKFHSIEQFRHVVREAPKETLKFVGTVKLHGTNASVVLDNEGNIYTQSKKNIITPEQDNYGFAQYVEDNKEHAFKPMLARIFSSIEYNNKFEYIAVYGEWCGKGIQDKVAITQLDKMFVIFGIKYGMDGEGHWLDLKNMDVTYPEQRVFNIFDFKHYEIDIDFRYPETVQTILTEITEEVENECPVGKHFGVSGLGEGVVWTNHEHHLQFKVKGQKHSVTKVKKLAKVDTEKVENIRKFIEYAVTENRLEQGANEVSPEFDIKKLGDFIRWIFNDVVKEESDTMADNGIDKKEIGKYISTVAKDWYFKKGGL